MSAAPRNRCPVPLSAALTDALAAIPEPTTREAVVRSEWAASTQPNAQTQHVPHLAQIVWFTIYSCSTSTSRHLLGRAFREAVHEYTDAKGYPRLSRREIASGVRTLRDRGLTPPWSVTPRFSGEV